MLGIAQVTEKFGFKALGVKVNLKKLLSEAALPCIVHWGQNHFVVVYKIKVKNFPLLWRGGGRFVGSV